MGALTSIRDDKIKAAQQAIRKQTAAHISSLSGQLAATRLMAGWAYNDLLTGGTDIGIDDLAIIQRDYTPLAALIREFVPILDDLEAILVLDVDGTPDLVATAAAHAAFVARYNLAAEIASYDAAFSQ